MTVPVPRVLSPKLCKNVRFSKSGDVVSIEQSNSFLFKLASQTRVHRVGVVFAANSCCASGVNNALSGLYAYLEESGRLFELVGFVGGPHAMTAASNSIIRIDSYGMCSKFNNLGGTELLGYSSFGGVDLDTVKICCIKLGLTSLVIIAASDELASARDLSNLLDGESVTVSIIPQSRNQHVVVSGGICSTSLGFDSARRILAEFAGNIAVDCISSKKYWHFINCGDAALVTEVALLIRANICVTESDKSVGIREWVSRVAELIEQRVEKGMRSGVVMVSQCAFSRTHEMERLRDELAVVAETTFPMPEHMARRLLSKESFGVLEKLPKEIKTNLLRKKDDHGRPKLSYWSPEEYLVDLVKAELKQRAIMKVDLTFRAHFLAHESRCPIPTPFDCVLGSTLGRTAAAFIIQNLHGYMVSVQGMGKSLDEWLACGIPISAPGVIQQRGYSCTAPVEAALKKLESVWAFQSRYRSFGPLQLPNASFELDPEFLPLTVMSERDDITKYLDNQVDVVDQPAARKWSGTEPPIRLPLRNFKDMSPLELQRRDYQPRIPGYLSEPFACIASDVCARVCTDHELVESVFPHSAKLLPVEIVSTTAGATNAISSGVSTPAYVVKPQQLLRRHTWRMTEEDDCSVMSEPSSSSEDDETSPVSVARMEARIKLPLFQKFVDDLRDTSEHPRRLMSPKSSRRTLPPEHPQLVKSNDIIWNRGVQGLRQESTDSSLSTGGTGRTTKHVDRPPMRIGVVFMCSQVPGCHNVVTGLFDYLSGCSAGGELIGFLGGPTGLRNGWFQLMTRELIDHYRNQGGQDLLGHFGESLVTEQDYAASAKVIQNLSLQGLVIVGNLEGQLAAALLTERFLAEGIETNVISVPASAENEIPFIRQSIGCDTVTRVFSSAISNLWTECHSSRHRWYFVRLMSHHVSHVALECALTTHPNIVLVTEEVAARKQSLAAITEMIADCICARSSQGKDYGIVLIPDGVVASVPEIKRLLRELDRITSKQTNNGTMNVNMRLELIQAQLSRFSSVIFKQLPRFVQMHLISGTRHSERSQIDIANVAMERILQSLVRLELEKRRRNEEFAGRCDLLVHSLAHQGRSSLPTAFDCDLAYTCGYTSGILVDSGRTGLLVNVEYLNSPDGEHTWSVGGFPLLALCGISARQPGDDETVDGPVSHYQSVQVTIEPTKLVMSGSACRALFNSIPHPDKREGHHFGPYQFNQCRNMGQLSLGNLDSWSAYEAITRDCREILTVVGMDTGKDSGLIESVVKSLENIVNLLEAKKSGPDIHSHETDWFLSEPNDILSTCTPSRVMSTYR